MVLTDQNRYTSYGSAPFYSSKRRKSSSNVYEEIRQGEDDSDSETLTRKVRTAVQPHMSEAPNLVSMTTVDATSSENAACDSQHGTEEERVSRWHSGYSRATASFSMSVRHDYLDMVSLMLCYFFFAWIDLKELCVSWTQSVKGIVERTAMGEKSDMSQYTVYFGVWCMVFCPLKNTEERAFIFKNVPILEQEYDQNR